jgi:hypothetical protein
MNSISESGHSPQSCQPVTRPNTSCSAKGYEQVKELPAHDHFVPRLPLAFIQPRYFPIELSWAKKTPRPVQFRKHENLLTNATTGGGPSHLLRLASLPEDQFSPFTPRPSPLDPAALPLTERISHHALPSGGADSERFPSPQLQMPEQLPTTIHQPDRNEKMKPWCETPRGAKPLPAQPHGKRLPSPFPLPPSPPPSPTRVCELLQIGTGAKC